MFKKLNPWFALVFVLVALSGAFCLAENPATFNAGGGQLESSSFFKGSSGEVVPVKESAGYRFPVTNSYSTASQTTFALKTTTQSITALAGREFISLIASGAFQYSVGTTTIESSSVAATSAEFLAGPAVPIGVQSGVEMNITVRQFGN